VYYNTKQQISPILQHIWLVIFDELDHHRKRQANNEAHDEADNQIFDMHNVSPSADNKIKQVQRPIFEAYSARSRRYLYLISS
jgi:hypothetical protein